MKDNRTRKILVILAIVLAGAVTIVWWNGRSAWQSAPSNQVGQDVLQASAGAAQGELPTHQDRAVKEPVSLVAVGDVMLSRHVWTKIKEHGGDPRYPFVETAKLTSAADVTFANLESPISDLAAPPAEGMSFIAPTKAIEGLEYAGIDIVSLANNHTGNFGDAALLDCQKQLEAHNIQAVGAGENLESAHAPIVLEIKGNRITFLAYEDVGPESYAAAAASPGVAWMDIELLKRDIEMVRDDADYVIVSMHSGTEYVFDPTAAQREFAHAAIDAGADLVIGHHPHVVQAKEIYQGKQIIYSLGNFVFDQMWSEETRRGEVLTATLEDGQVKDIEFVKIKIFDYNQPQISS